MIPFGVFFGVFFLHKLQNPGHFCKIRDSGTSFKIREIPGKSGRVGSYETIIASSADEAIIRGEGWEVIAHNKCSMMSKQKMHRPIT